MGSSRWVTGRAEGGVLGLCRRVQSDGPNGIFKGNSKLPFLFRLQLHVILFFPTWESCGGRFCPMSGDRAAHEVTQQYYIGNHGATNAKGEGLDQVSEESQVEG